jgi:hypothetical protein
MLYGVEVAVCSEVNTKQIKTMYAEYQFLSFKPVGARNQQALNAGKSHLPCDILRDIM